MADIPKTFKCCLCGKRKDCGKMAIRPDKELLWYVGADVQVEFRLTAGRMCAKCLRTQAKTAIGYLTKANIEAREAQCPTT